MAIERTFKSPKGMGIAYATATVFASFLGPLTAAANILGRVYTRSKGWIPVTMAEMDHMVAMATSKNRTIFVEYGEWGMECTEDGRAPQQIWLASDVGAYLADGEWKDGARPKGFGDAEPKIKRVGNFLARIVLSLDEYADRFGTYGGSHYAAPIATLAKPAPVALESAVSAANVVTEALALVTLQTAGKAAATPKTEDSQALATYLATSRIDSDDDHNEDQEDDENPNDYAMIRDDYSTDTSVGSADDCLSVMAW